MYKKIQSRPEQKKYGKKIKGKSEYSSVVLTKTLCECVLHFYYSQNSNSGEIAAGHCQEWDKKPTNKNIFSNVMY